FWPGPLTLILGEQKSLGLHLGDTRGTVAVRVPDHDGARELLRRTGPLAVSSANVSGNAPATTCAAAQEQLGERVEVYLDGGPTPGMSPSTIVEFSSDEGGVVLRVGALSTEQLQDVVESVRLHDPEPPEPEDEAPDAEPDAAADDVDETEGPAEQPDA
ncbi:MAG: L-threonylcarbamoyladenylate synthase, partial [Propionibacterium sp.]|nr:L-threonylcarbamoyladenylate synthase [Propionibacterium sp.]